MVEFALLTLLGLVLGSFLSVVTYRIPRGMSFVYGRSFCDKCKKELRWYDNIPLFSFLRYKGVSRCCGQKIAYRYPLIELSTSIGILILWNITSSPLILFVYLVTLAIFIIDLENQIIPDELSLTLFCVGFLGFSGINFLNLFPAFFAALIILLIHIVTKGQGMGLGDVKLMIALGLWFGLMDNINLLMVAFIIGGIVAFLLLLLKKAKLKTKIAFGPFLILAFWFEILKVYFL